MAVEPRRPNIVILQTDDQGFDDVGFNGNDRVKTPSMDKIAREGVIFSQFYSHETCAPTRSSLITGRHFLDAGVWGVHGGRDYLSLDETTLAEVFRYNGYRTGIFGKWYLGKTPGYFPWDRGFDEAWMVGLYQYTDNVMLHNGKLQPTQGWASSVTTQLALDFIDQNAEQPFLLYVPYMEPHEGNGPDDPAYTWHAPKEFSEPYLNSGLSPAMARFYGMISHVDYQMGRILNKLAEKGIEENTIVIFMSDNGAIGSSSYSNATDWQIRNPSQLRGNKGTIFENGIRIPFAIRWKSHISPGIVKDISIVQDVFPTLLNLTGLNFLDYSKSLGGTSFADTLRLGRSPVTARSIYFSTRAPYFLSSSNDKEFYLIPNRGLDRSRMTVDSIQTAIRKGQWKLVNDVGHYQLFDLITDPRELHPVQDPVLTESLKQELKAWWARTLASPGTFNRPRFQIGRHKETFSRVYANGAISLQGPIRLGTESAIGWTGVGDSVSLLVEVKRKGLYQVYVKGRPLPQGLRVKLQLGEQTIEGEVSQLPPILLNFGQSDLTLTITSAPMGTFTSLEAIDFELTREDQRYPDCQKFQGGFGAKFACGSMSCRKSDQRWYQNAGEDSWCLFPQG